MPRKRLTVALDAHGGDHGLDVILPAALDALRLAPELQILLAGRPEELEPRLAQSRHARLGMVAADSVLTPETRMSAVLRAGGASSLGAAIQQVADGVADACVSAGSTAALVALGARQLGLLAGIRRPALMSDLPADGGKTAVLDLGANVDVTAVQLVQFAIMGAIACEREDGAPARVGLLNVGHEEIKGHAVVREAHLRLRELPLNYVGFIEGNDIFTRRVDVAVCDGFAGNLLLKSSEGLARMLFGELRKALRRDARSRLAGWLARPALRSVLEQLDPGKHNGAPLLGLRGVVVKSHGSADRPATVQAILEAMREARRRVPGRIEERIRQFEAGDST